MARSTWGSIREKSKGVWEIRYTVGDEGKRKQKSVIERGSRKKAEQRLADLRVRYEEPSASAPEIKVGQCWRLRYWPAAEKGLAASTREGYLSQYRANIESAWGDRTMSEIKAWEVQEWLDGLSYGAARGAKAVMSIFFGWAESKEIIDRNVMARRYQLPKKSPENTKRVTCGRVYSKSELDAIFTAARGEIWEGPGILSAFGGGRREEVCSPRLAEISFEDIVIGDRQGMFALYDVARTVLSIRGEVIVREDEAKTDASMRWIVVPSPYSLRLQEIVSGMLRDGHTWLLDDGFGEVLDPEAMSRAWRRWFLRQPFDYIPFANLRNSYGTVMHALGLDLAMVGKLMRHKDQATTYRYYDRPGKDELTQAVLRVMGKQG